MSHPDFIGVSFLNIKQKGKLPGQARHDSVDFPLLLNGIPVLDPIEHTHINLITLRSGI